MHLKRSLRGFLKLLSEKGSRALTCFLRDRLYTRWCEYRLGIRSESCIELRELGIENEFYRPYVATDYRSFRKVLNTLRIRPGQDVFLDLGSGLGRAVIMAATR